MAKDFDSWNNVKKGIDRDSRLFDFHKREIWWISCGINVGIEIDGKHSSFERPCIILRKFNEIKGRVIGFLEMNEDPQRAGLLGGRSHNQS